jgi:hypothetical protein
MTGEFELFERISISHSGGSFSSMYGEKISFAAADASAARLSALLVSRRALIRGCKSVSVTYEDKGIQGIREIWAPEAGRRDVAYVLPYEVVMDRSDIEALLIRIFCSIMTTLAGSDVSNAELVEKCQRLLLSQRNRVRILHKKADFKDFVIEIHFGMLEPYAEFRQVYLRVINKASGIEAHRLVAELLEGEFCRLIQHLSIVDGAVIIKGANSPAAIECAEHYKARGFNFPLKISLEKLFDCQSD